ncbi:TonB-dependent receptor [Silanimonas lenta]|uniref:TonB-dependent receptor n=1 Tax=Silanimonas lenta TaxID=265429 RepID=UPI000408F090|nr:TonB-dependent receptor [Silanimonas lenta]
MSRPSSPLRRPATLRRTLLAVGLSTATLAIAAPAPEAADEEEVELDTLRIEGRAADVNPYASEGAPYKARISGDARRVLPLAETPATLTVITERQLKDSGRADFRAILDAQPGITLGTGEGGNQFGDRYIIRGQEARSDIFVDGLRDPGLQARESFAVEQIEITKGPSATFAGRGASGGSVNAISKQASTEYDFHNLEIGAGTQNHVRSTLDSNFKLSETLALRANLLYTREDVPDRAPAKRERYGLALAGRADLGEAVSLLADYYRVSGRDRTDLGQAIAGLDAGGQPFRDIPPYAQKEDFQDGDVDILSLRFQWRVSDALRLENIARWGRTEGGYLVSQGARFTRGANDPVAPGAVDYRISNTRSGWQDIDYLADRLNLVAEFETGALRHTLVAGIEYTDYDVDGRHGAGTTGGYGFTASGPFNCVMGTGSVPNAWCVTDGRGNRLVDFDRLVGRRDIVRNGIPTTSWNVKTVAGYLMDSVELTPWLSLAGGLRFDDYDFRLVTRNGSTGAVTGDYASSDVIRGYNASLTAKPHRNGIVYLAWATGADINGGESDVGTNCGYGGLCTVIDPVSGELVFQGEPERSRNLELGTKWNLFDDQLLLTAAVFETVKSDLFEGGVNSYVANGGQLNGGKHRVRGIELGATGNFTERLSGQLSATLMDSEVLESSDSNFTAQQRALGATNVGKPLSNFAERSFDAQLRYRWTERFSLGANATYQSEMYAGQPDAAAAINTTIINGQPGPNFGRPNIRIPSHTVFGAFAEYAINERLSLRLNGLNLGDKQYYLAGYRSGGFAYLGDGRTLRLTLSGKF